MERTGGGGDREGKGMAKAKQETGENFRRGLKPTAKKIVPGSSRTKNAVWSGRVSGTSSKERIIQRQERRPGGAGKTSRNSKECSTNDSGRITHLAKRSTRYACQPAPVPSIGRQSAVPSGTQASNPTQHTSATQAGESGSKSIC